MRMLDVREKPADGVRGTELLVDATKFSFDVEGLNPAITGELCPDPDPLDVGFWP
jgi:hypothetical protein